MFQNIYCFFQLKSLRYFSPYSLHDFFEYVPLSITLFKFKYRNKFRMYPFEAYFHWFETPECPVPSVLPSVVENRTQSYSLLWRTCIMSQPRTQSSALYQMWLPCSWDFSYTIFQARIGTHDLQWSSKCFDHCATKLPSLYIHGNASAWKDRV